jgi:argininosuccinate synthase
MKKIVLAYTGGVTTSAAIAWLRAEHRAEVVTVTVDVGQGHALEHVRERALAIGAVRAHVVDAREEFARDFVLPALHAGALDDGQCPLPAALARPVIARHLVAIARLEGARVIAHGSAEGDPDRPQLETAIQSIDPSLAVLAPADEWGMTPDGVLAYARAEGIPVLPVRERGGSADANLWGRVINAAILGGDQDPPEEMFERTESPARAPEHAALVEITFERGVPLAVNGVTMPLTELIASLETIAGSHAVGRVGRVNRGDAAGAPAREIVEAPAAVVLHAAHRALQRSVTPRDLQKVASTLGATYADIVDRGLWYTPTREATDALVAKVQERVTGTVRAKLVRGQCQIVGAASPFAPAPPARAPRRMAAMGRK